MFRSLTAFIAFVIFPLMFAAAAAGQAGPPLIGDDPGTPGTNHWEINIAYTVVRTPHQVTMETPHVDLNYGLGDNIQLTYQGGWLIGKEEGGNWSDGINNSLAGVKWRFLDEEKYGLGMSTFPQLGFNTTNSLARTGVVDSGLNFFLPVEIGKTFGRIEVAAEVGYQYVEHGPDQFVAGVVVGYVLTKKIELLLEARNALDLDLRHNNLIFDGGARVGITEHIQLLLAAGRSVESGDDSTLLYVYAGVGFTF
ncbi:MAG TPA: hypothetical protein VG326_03315 [Tepidisphaeraceae bacterium]|jgi:hypothetical protein|nr:hypothetical protein [Tepidisphaeraceae bacterium]